MRHILALLMTLAACSSGGGTAPALDADAASPTPLERLSVRADDPALREAATRFFEFMPPTDRAIERLDAPSTESALEVRLVLDGALCSECYALGADGPSVRTIRTGGVLGAHYALAEALERLGWAFPHPMRPIARAAYPADELARDADALQTPVVREPLMARRGLHLHTLHPIEALDAFWMPSDGARVRARQMLDWMVKNRANFVEWVALGDIERPAAHGPWRAHTRGVLDDAHALGLKVGLGVQLFGASNLQKAFDLLDELPSTAAEADMKIEARLRLVVDGLGFDVFNLSFGEFSGVEPAVFVENVDRTYATLKRLDPNAEMAATIHVGDSEDLRVSYRGETLLYYFLVKFANPAIEPWVHTVMFYNLFDSAGGAYDHAEFDEHRAFLRARLEAGEPVGYFPETAYWIAFDNSVPQWLPVYQTSRRLDLDGIEQFGALPTYVLFSSGWEWGYWAHDADALRRSYMRDAEWPQGAALRAELMTSADAAAQARAQTWSKWVEGVGALQREALIVGELAPYTAGRDFFVDAGEMGGIIAAPARVRFDALLAADAEVRGQFTRDVLEPLKDYADALERTYDEVGVLTATARGPYEAELADGARIALLRPRFVAALYAAVLDRAAGRPEQASLEAADALLAQAREVVAARHANRHDRAPHLTARWSNPTIYQFGYLLQADTLCMWDRERVQIRNALEGGAEPVPNCAL